MFGKDKCREKLTYVIRDEGSNTTLVKESLVKELNLDRQPIDFTLTTMNKVSQESGRSPLPICSRFGTERLSRNPKRSVAKVFSVARNCIFDGESGQDVPDGL